MILNEAKNNEILNKSSVKEDEVTSSEETSNITTFPTHLPTNNNDILFESATKLLYLAVKWAKSIPSFNQFSLADQKFLLEESWGELFVVAAAQWGLSIDEDFLRTYPHLYHLQAVVKNFQLLKVDQFEAACLKALILFKGELNKSFSAVQQISLLQNQTLCLLVEKGGGLRLGHLLLNLPQIKTAGNPKKLQVSLIWWFLRIFLIKFFIFFRTFYSSTLLGRLLLRGSWRKASKFKSIWSQTSHFC